MEKAVVLVVDVQNALVEAHPFHEAAVIRNIRKLIEAARRNQVEVIYVRHDGGTGDELEKNTKGWEIYKEIAPLPTDRVFDKSYNSAFKATGLQSYLDGKGVASIILVGMQTEYCIDTTCKAAFEHGYRLMIPQAATTTFDNDFFLGEMLVRYYEQKIWNGRFAEVIPVDEVIERISGSTAK